MSKRNLDYDGVGCSQKIDVNSLECPKHICDQPVSLVVEESAHKKKALNAFDKNLGFEGVECGGKEFYAKQIFDRRASLLSWKFLQSGI